MKNQSKQLTKLFSKYMQLSFEVLMLEKGMSFSISRRNQFELYEMRKILFETLKSFSKITGDKIQGSKKKQTISAFRYIKKQIKEEREKEI